MKSTRSLSVGWIVFNAAALAASLSHVLIDSAAGLYGNSSAVMSPLQATNILLISFVYAYWMLLIAWTERARKSALISLLLLTAVWSFLANGVAGLAACPPLCSTAFPYQDIAHISSLIFGGLTAYMSGRTIKTSSEPINWWLPGCTIALMVTAFVVQSMLASLYIR